MQEWWVKGPPPPSTTGAFKSGKHWDFEVGLYTGAHRGNSHNNHIMSSGVDPYTTRQSLLHHAYSPVVSIHASHQADELFRRFLDLTDISALHFLQSYGDNAKLPVANQRFKITNTLLITRSYPSFPIRFESSLPDLILLYDATRASRSPVVFHDQLGSSRSSSVPPSHTHPLRQQFSITSLNQLLIHNSADPHYRDSLYENYFANIIKSNSLLLFDTFNHPVSQVFVIDFASDTLQDVRDMIVAFRNYNFPRYFQIDDLLFHVFVCYDSAAYTSTQVSDFQDALGKKLSLTSTAFPMSNAPQQDTTVILLVENSTIEANLQRISLQPNQAHASSSIEVPLPIHDMFASRIHDYISRLLIPHMQIKIRAWDDVVLQPKRSITGRFFSASRKFFNSNGSDSALLPSVGAAKSNAAFNAQENYYYKSSPEQMIRKLADWALILKDFKYAYSTYELIKKDYTNDKAWVYVASAQEMCIVSLLLAHTQPAHAAPVDRSTLRKIRHDIIEPYLDNLTYTFRSRLNLKTFAIRATAIVIELLLCICSVLGSTCWWDDLIEKYLLKCIVEYENHLASHNQHSHIFRALLYERSGYSSSRCVYIVDEYKYLLAPADNQQTQLDVPVKNQDACDEDLEDPRMFRNPIKLQPARTSSIAGLTRFKKLCAWYLLAAAQWLRPNNTSQITRLLNIIWALDDAQRYSPWFNRPGSLLGDIARLLNAPPASVMASNSPKTNVEGSRIELGEAEISAHNIGKELPLVAAIESESAISMLVSPTFDLSSASNVNLSETLASSLR